MFTTLEDSPTPASLASDVLVLTGSAGHLHGLQVGFTRATVIEIADEAAVGAFEATFDLVLLDPGESDPAWLGRLLGPAARAMRPGGRVFISVTCACAQPVEERGSDPYAAFSWGGVVTVGAIVCAVLHPCDQPTEGAVPVGPLLATARTTSRLAGAVSRGQERLSAARRESAALAIAADQRRRSEEELLGHLGALTERLAWDRDRHRGVRLGVTVLRRSPAGRAARRVVRALRPVTGRILRLLR
jgi:hypothetical protein